MGQDTRESKPIRPRDTGTIARISAVGNIMSANAVKTLRLEPSTWRLITALMDKLGLNFPSIVRLAVRRLAEQEGIE